jgi:hypothetical protein
MESYRITPVFIVIELILILEHHRAYSIIADVRLNGKVAFTKSSVPLATFLFQKLLCNYMKI